MFKPSSFAAIALLAFSGHVGAQTPAPEPQPVQTFEIAHPSHLELHFDSNWKLITPPNPEGYVRKILGTTAQGQLVVQDFHAKTQLPYTSPAVLNSAEAALQWMFDSPPAQTSLTYYDEQGRKGRWTATQPESAVQEETYHPNGHVATRITKLTRNLIRTDKWYPDGQQNGTVTYSDDNENRPQLHSMRMWWPNGAPRFVIHTEGDAGGKASAIQAWSADGAPLQEQRQDLIDGALYALLVDLDYTAAVALHVALTKPSPKAKKAR